MSTKIVITPELDEAKLRQQLNDIKNKKEKITVDINPENINNADTSMRKLNNTVANSNTAFGKLKSAINNTFSTGKLTMTGYLAVLNEIRKAAKEAKKAVEEISEATMNLQISSGLAREQVQGLIKDYSVYGKTLGSSAVELAKASDDYLRSGKSLKEASELIKSSTILSKLGKLDSAEATNDILAVMNGFNMTIDEVNRAIDTMVKYDTSVAVSSGEIATAMQYVASNANASSISFEKMAAMISVVRDRTRLSAESIGTALNTIISRYKDITIGKYLDSDGEEIGNTEKVLRSLGVELRDEKKEFRSFEAVLDELAKSWDSYSSVQQAAISKQFAGTRQANKFIALVSNYNKVLELTEASAGSAGIAVTKFNEAYLNSIEAKRNQLQNSFESLVINTNFEEVYSDILGATTALVDFINQTNALKGVMSGLAVSGGIKAFLAIKTGIIEAYINLNRFQNSLNILKQTTISTNDFDRLLLLTNSLSASQMKLVLSSKSLTTQQKQQLVVNSALGEEEKALLIQTYGLTTAETGLTAATTTLGMALSGLWNLLIANPLILVTAAVSATVMAWQSYNQKLEETRQANIESATAASENADKLKDLYNEYTRLASIQDRTTSEEEAFKTAVENITVALGDKAEILKDLTAGTDEYADALARVTKEELQSQAVTATIGRKSAEEVLQGDIWSDWKGSKVSIDSNSKGKALSDESQKAVDIVSDSLKEFETINRTWKNISWDISSNDPTEALEYYNSLVEAREKLVLASKDDEALLDTEIYKDLNTAINTMSESLDTYIEKLYEEQKLSYMAKNGIPSVTGEYKDMESALVSAAGSSVDLQNRFKELLTSDFSDLATNIENVGDTVENVSNELKQIDGIEISFDQVWADSFTSENEEVKKLGGTLLDLAEKGRLTAETFTEADSTGYFKNLGISADIAVSKINKLVDESKQLSSMSDQISKMSEALGTKKENGFVDADTLSGFDVEVRGLDSWDRFQTVLGSTTSSYEECQEAANDLATEWVNSSDFLAQLTEDTKEYYETQLKDMGVENYDEVIESTLALKEAKEALADVDLADASYEDIESLIAEGEYSALVTEQMWALYYAKLAESGTFLDSSADCAQLQALANDAMLTAEAVELLNQLIQIYNGLEAGTYNNNRALREEAVAEADRIKKELENLAKGEGDGLIAKPELKINGSKGKKSSGGSGGSKDKWKEAYEQELKELDHMHKLGLISDAEYWKARMDLNEKYFGESSGKHQKYLDEYQNNEEDILEGLKKLWEDYFNERKDNLKDLISYAEKLYDREIDSLEANIKQIEEKRDAEKKYWQGRIDAIGDEIDALEDANDERERAIDLQNKQYHLQKAMHQRTILLYSESKGMHYVNDTKAEHSAKNDLDDVEHDNKVADLKKQQKDLEKQLDIILETYDSQIESIEKQIDKLKEVKSAWSDIVENQEFKELEERLKSLFGDDIKNKILSGNTDFINSIISQYSDTSDMLRTIEDATLADIQNMVAQYGILPENLMPIADAATNIANTLGTVDTSGFNTNLDNTAHSSSNAAEKVQTVTTALNDLSNDVSNYQMPAINTDNFSSTFAEDGEILTALNGFIERYKEICDNIPEIWNNSLAEAFGQGGGTGDPLAGGLANDTKYDALFEPVIDALDNCKANIESKLKECLGTFTTFQTDLSGVIGVGGGNSEDSVTSQASANGGKGKSSGSEKQSESGGGADTIVGAIQDGGALIEEALNGEDGSWSASFATAQESIHYSATSIVECIESMVETVVSACIKAIEAINMLASADKNNSNNPTPSPYGKVGHAHAEGVNGTKTYEKDAIVSEYGQREMTVFPNGKTVITDTPTAMDLPKGSVVYNEEQTEKILKNKVTATGNAYANGTDADGWITLADGTKARPLQPGDRAWELQQKFNAYLESIDNNLEKLVTNSYYEHQRQMEQWTKNINYVSSITNNNRNVQQPIHNTFNITLPNVTNSTSAESLLKDLESIGRKKYQVDW